jgi:hypothetical protein
MKKIRVRLKMPSTHMVAGKARIPTYIFNFLQYLLPTIKEKNCLFFLMQCKTKFLMILHLPITICCNDAGKATKISDSAFANCKIWQWLKHISLQHEVYRVPSSYAWVMKFFSCILRYIANKEKYCIAVRAVYLHYYQ